MLTLFTTAKAFRGHIAIIQRNALKSWTLLDPQMQIILFGDDPGTAEAARDFGALYRPEAPKTPSGAMRLDYMFATAEELSPFGICCYVNCDIILMPDFLAALRRTQAAYSQFLMIGRRWDIAITQPLRFDSPAWQRELVAHVRQSAKQRTPDWIDYFAFSRGVYGSDLPPLAIGRLFWDNWLVWKAMAGGNAVVDVSQMVLAVHQNHDYNHHPQAEKGIWHGEDQRANFRLTGGYGHLRTIANATYVLTATGIARNRFQRLHYWRVRAGHAAMLLFTKAQRYMWHPFLDATRPLRKALGLRKSA
jgi:hypothetical protein